MYLSTPALAHAQATTPGNHPDRKETTMASTLTEVPRAPAAHTIHPFTFRASDEAIADLRRRIQATRFPGKELVADRSQGVQLATLQRLARYWTSEYDWRRAEARLNALPQFTTEIDGVEIHFIHVRSRHENALPMIMTHGWPGSVIELLETVGPLTDPTAHGGTPEDAFHLVLPSLPAYGFSGQPTELGWENGRIASAWAELMDRLGYTHYVAQGGDVGAAVTDAMGRQGPEGLLGIHVNLLAGAIGIKDQLPAKSAQERAAHDALNTFTTDGFGYFLEQSTRPQTIGYSLLDSPVGLAAWMLDHDTDSYYKISRAFVDDEPVGGLTRESIVYTITLYWLTGTGASAARWYWEFGRFLATAGASGQAPPPVSVPVGFTTFHLDDIRAILGNDVAIETYREGKLPFPDNTIIARLAWSYDASEENNQAFGRAQSFVAGHPKNGVQFMVRDSEKYPSTGGWGYGHFDDGKTADVRVLNTCFACHLAVKERDFVFTRYSP
jgi:pimeloyl-ACP methyl ester carboxylesterase